ncbi:MAG TPA: hypothetical protein VMT89_16755, partial [Candidatus Acidoferrales bacterium]|nr:hypothetical protein [Candidatus Acidoferrales bacterium]
AANGPKGLAIVRELGDGVMCVNQPQPGFSWCSLLVLGTVLDDGEEASSERALAAAGPGLTVAYHGTYEVAGAAAVDGLPGGAEWRAHIDAIPEHERHLALHELHLVGISERDRPLLNGEMLKAFTWTGSAADIRDRLANARDAGATEIMYAPMGPDVARELETFKRATS